MTSEQMSLMIQVLQFGYATGGATRFDCLRAFAAAHPEQRLDAIAAAAEFERGCGYCPEQREALQAMTTAEFTRWVFPEKIDPSYRSVSAPVAG